MPNMISLQDRVLRSLSGHTVTFNSKEPTYVPKEAVAEALAIGCAFAEESDAPVTLFDDDRKVRAGFEGNIRFSAIFIALRQIAESNNAKQFDASGQPKAAAVNELLGFDVQPKELTEVWRAYHSATKEGREVALAPEGAGILKVVQAGNAQELLELAKELGVKDAAITSLRGKSTRDIRAAMLTHLSGITG